MKPIEYLYFNIYNHFYQKSYHARDFYARLQAMYLCSLYRRWWILFLETAYLGMPVHVPGSARNPGLPLFAATVYLMMTVIFNQILYSVE